MKTLKMKIRKIVKAFALVAIASLGFSQLSAEAAETYSVSVKVHAFSMGTGTVSGGKANVKAGTRLTVKAKPAKNNAFVAWTLGDKQDGTVVSRSASYTFKVEDNVALSAFFVSAEKDMLDVSVATPEAVFSYGVGEKMAERQVFLVNSRSAAKVSLSGLPSGVKSRIVTNDKGQVEVSCYGAAKKQGVYWVTCKASNANGYKHSTTIKWTVGNPAETDYDQIGLGQGLEDLGGMATGHYAWISLADNGNVPAVVSAKGLPSGLQFTPYGEDDGFGSPMPAEIYGLPEKAGKFTVTFKAQDGRKAVRTFIVRDSGSAYFEVGPGTSIGEGKGTGKVSGTGVYPIGSKVKISATPARNCYFAGWWIYEGGVPSSCPSDALVSGSWIKASDSLKFSYMTNWGVDDIGEFVPTEPKLTQRLYAKFVTKEEDSVLSLDFWSGKTWIVSTGESWISNPELETTGTPTFDVVGWSKSEAKLTAKTLPAGIKMEEWNGSGTLYVSDKKKLKPGTYSVKLTLKNKSGATVSDEIVIVIPNLQSTRVSGLDHEREYAFCIGNAVDSALEESGIYNPQCAFTVEEGWKVSASGLPAGLKLSKSGTTAAFTGRPTKAGTYTVRLTLTKGRVTDVATITFRVDPFPAAGTYTGVLTSSEGEQTEFERECQLPCGAGDVDGTISLTATTAGKFTAKLVSHGKTISLSGYGTVISERQVIVKLMDTKGHVLDLMVVPTRGMCQVTGSAASVNGSFWGVFAQRNDFAKDPSLKECAVKLAGRGKMTLADVSRVGGFVCPHDDGIDPLKTTVKVDKKGVVTVAGKLGGKTFSGSSQLMFSENVAYADFYKFMSSGERRTQVLRVIFGAM